jgi:small subunit ribosomal protein S6
MFLFDSNAARDWAAIEQEVHRLCNRITAELLVCVKFDERKLAYEIKRRKRGTYVLTYFDAPAERLTDLERDAELSELVLRLLVLRADDVPEERIAELKLWPAETPLQPGSGDGRRHEEPEHGFRGRERAEAGPEPGREFEEAAEGAPRGRSRERGPVGGFEELPRDTDRPV